MRLQFEYEKTKWESVAQASLSRAVIPEDYQCERDYRRLPTVNSAPPFLMFPAKNNAGDDSFEYDACDSISERHDIEDKTSNKGNMARGEWGYGSTPMGTCWPIMNAAEDYALDGNCNREKIEDQIGGRNEPTVVKHQLLSKKRKFSCPLKVIE